jgi:geranylgeranyl pyrophosphate synthase
VSVILSAEELLGGDGSAAGVLAGSCRYAVAQTGKQLRSRLVGEASRLGSGETPDVKTAARAVELLHVATLAHDDVIDDSPLRRGHASLEARSGGFAAGCTGAWLFGTAIELAGECGQEAVELLAAAACELCDGEMREMRDLYDGYRDEQSYLQTIASKTATLFSLSARLGGLTGQAPSSACAELARYGHSLGMAFQLADDIRDLLDAPGRNKRLGDDLRHGICTLPMIYAIEVDPSLREAITCDVADDAVQAIVDRMRATGAFVRASSVRDMYGAAARSTARHLQAPWLEAFVDEALGVAAIACRT